MKGIGSLSIVLSSMERVSQLNGCEKDKQGSCERSVCDMQEENRLDIRGMELHTAVISGLFSLTL